MDGPGVKEALAALVNGDVTPVFKWVKKEHEGEIKMAFEKTRAARAKEGTKPSQGRIAGREPPPRVEPTLPHARHFANLFTKDIQRSRVADMPANSYIETTIYGRHPGRSHS